MFTHFSAYIIPTYIIPLDQASWCSCLLQATKVIFPLSEHFNNFISSTTFCFNIYGSKMDTMFSSGSTTLTWKVTYTNNSSIFDTAFIQYWRLKFYSKMAFLTQTCYQPRKHSIFTWDTISPEDTSNKNNLQPSKLYISTETKERDLRLPKLT